NVQADHVEPSVERIGHTAFVVEVRPPRLCDSALIEAGSFILGRHGPQKTEQTHAVRLRSRAGLVDSGGGDRHRPSSSYKWTARRHRSTGAAQRPSPFRHFRSLLMRIDPRLPFAAALLLASLPLGGCAERVSTRGSLPAPDVVENIQPG